MALGLLVLSWGVVAFREPALTPNYDNLVWQKLAGESFGPDQLQKLRTPCGSYDRNDHPRAALLAALVAARDLELALVEGEPEELRRLATCASDATRHLLHQNPASSMGWFLLAWTARLDGTDPGQAARYLDRSVQMAPREVWMAIKRVPLMQVEVLRGRPEFVRGDYRVLAEGEKPALAAVLLRACVLTFPLCEMDWNAGLTTRQTSLVWAEMVRDN
jgi:hypothetical protein